MRDPGAGITNPDTRPLPAGWSHHTDQNGSWYYVNTNATPPQISYTHPAGVPTHASALSPISNPQAGQIPRSTHDAQAKMLAQQLYASSVNSAMRASPRLTPPNLSRAASAPRHTPVSPVPSIGALSPTSQLSPAGLSPSSSLYQTSPTFGKLPGNLTHTRIQHTQPAVQHHLQRSATYSGEVPNQSHIGMQQTVQHGQAPQITMIVQPPTQQALQPNRTGGGFFGVPRTAVAPQIHPQYAPTLPSYLGTSAPTPGIYTQPVSPQALAQAQIQPPHKLYEPLTTELAAQKAREGAKHTLKALKKMGKASKDVGKAAWRVAGTAMLGVPPQALAGAAVGIMNSDMINALVSSFSNGEAGMGQVDLQAVLQGNLDADYAGVIAALAQQQQQQQAQLSQQELQQQGGTGVVATLQPAVDYQALISELQRMQNLANARAAAAAAAAAQTHTQATQMNNLQLLQQNTLNAQLQAMGVPGVQNQLGAQHQVNMQAQLQAYQKLQAMGPNYQTQQQPVHVYQQQLAVQAALNKPTPPLPAQLAQLPPTHQSLQAQSQPQPLSHVQQRPTKPGYQTSYMPQATTTNPHPSLQPSQITPPRPALHPNRPSSTHSALNAMPRPQLQASTSPPPPSSISPLAHSHSHSTSASSVSSDIAINPSQSQAHIPVQPLNQMPQPSLALSHSAAVSSLPLSRPPSQAQLQPAGQIPQFPTPPSSPPQPNQPPSFLSYSSPTDSSTMGHPHSHTQTQNAPTAQTTNSRPPADSQVHPAPSGPAQAYPLPPGEFTGPVDPAPTTPQVQQQSASSPPLPLYQPQPVQPIVPPPAQPQSNEQQAQGSSNPISQPPHAAQQPTQPQFQPTQSAPPPPPFEYQPQQAQQPPPQEPPYEAYQPQVNTAGQPQNDTIALSLRQQGEQQQQAMQEALSAAQQQQVQQQQALQDALAAAQEQQQAMQDAFAAAQQQQAQQQQAMEDALAATQQQQTQQQAIYQQAYQQQEALNLATQQYQQQQQQDMLSLVQAAYGQQQQQDAQLQSLIQAAYAQPTQSQDAQFQNLLQAAYGQSATTAVPQQQEVDMQTMLQAAALQQQQQQQNQLNLLIQQQAQAQAQQPSAMETFLQAALGQPQPEQQSMFDMSGLGLGDASGSGGLDLMGALTSGFDALTTLSDSYSEG